MSSACAARASTRSGRLGVGENSRLSTSADRRPLLPGGPPALVQIVERLTIAGSREERHEDQHDGGYRTEFRYGSFERSVRLPVGAKTDEVTATYTDGILEVRVPVDTETPTATTIPIAKK